MEIGQRNGDAIAIFYNWQNFTDKTGEARLIEIDQERLDSVAWEHRLDEFSMPDWRVPGIYPEDDRAFAAQTIVSSVFNAAFNVPGKPGEKWTLPNLDNPAKPFTGAMALHRSMYNTFGEQPDITADELAQHLQDEESLEHFLPGVPYPELRLQVGRDFVQGLRGRYGGKVQNILAVSTDPHEDTPHILGIDRQAHRIGLVDRLTDTTIFGSAFEDSSYIGAERVVFNKRAYLAGLVYYGRARTSETLPPLSDVDSLGPVADYELPRFLRMLGILQYAPELAEKVDAWQEIEAGSTAEVQIRAATVAATIELEDALNFYRKTAANRGEPQLDEPKVNPAQLDYWLWNTGRQLPDTSPPHLTKTTAY